MIGQTNPARAARVGWRMPTPDPSSPPLIGIAPDVAEPTKGSAAPAPGARIGRPRAECSLAYAESAARAGGLPRVLAPIPELMPHQLSTFDGFVMTGGDDPTMEAFGAATHPKATPMHPARQAYDTALIRALLARPEIPVLGICLGMQMLALVN